MATEIERKYLVEGDGWRESAKSYELRQGYILKGVGKVVRIRTVDQKGYICVKALVSGIERMEFEYEIPYTDALEMLNTLCTPPLIEKTRHKLTYGGKIWEIDEFHGVNRGLIVAEVELDALDEMPLLPDWVGTDVSEDPRYFNANLSLNPYTR